METINVDSEGDNNDKDNTDPDINDEWEDNLENKETEEVVDDIKNQTEGVPTPVWYRSCYHGVGRKQKLRLCWPKKP